MNPPRPCLRFALRALLLALTFSTAHAAAPPQVEVSSPAHSGFDKADWEITGMVVDFSYTGFLNNRVTLSISRSGQYWDGSGWTISESPIELYAEIDPYGTTWTYPGASGDTLPTDEGEYAISASVTDNDNVSSAPVAGGEFGNNQITFRLDTTPPDCAILSPAGGPTLSAVGATVTFAGTASDGYPAQPEVTLLIKHHRDTIYWDGQHWTPYLEYAAIPATHTSAKGWTSSKPMPQAGWDETHSMTNGSYTFTATARDAAGNTTQHETTVTVELPVNYPLAPFGPQQIAPLSAEGITQSEMVDYSALPAGDERVQSPAIVRITADNSLVTGVNMRSTNGSYYDPVYYPSAAVIKHAANGSELWRKERELHSVTITSGDTPITTHYERWSPADPWREIYAGDYTPYYTLSAMELDAAGNTYAGFDLSYAYSSNSYEPERGNASIVAKFDPNGNLVWRSRIDNPYETNSMLSLKPLADGSAVALVSNTWQTYHNYWPYGYDSGGQTVVMRVGADSGNFKHQFGYSELGSSYYSTPLGIDVDPAGNIVVVSRESDTADGIHQTLHKIRKIAADGTILKTVIVPTSASPESWRRMCLDPLTGDVFISGLATENTTDLSRSAVLKFDLDNAAGSELVWRRFGPARSGGYGETYLSVSHNSVTVAETGTESYDSNADRFVSVVTFDKNGQLLWSRKNSDPALEQTQEWGAIGGLALNHMIADAAGNVYLVCKGARGGLIKMAANGDLQFAKPFPEGYASLEGGYQREGQMQILADNSIAVLVQLPFDAVTQRATVLKISNPAIAALPLSIGEDNPADQSAQVGSPLTLTVINSGSPATYQWEKDDANGIPQPIPGETGPSLTITSAAETDIGLYRVILTSTVDPGDVLTSRKASVTVYSLVSLPEALDTPGLVWETNAPDSWIGQTAITSDGVDAAMNAALASHEAAWMQTTVAGPGTFSFHWKSQDPANDWLSLYLDPIGESDGSTLAGNYSEEFVQKSIEIPAGTHTLRFRFSSAVAGNRGVVDRVEFVRDAQAPAVALEVPAAGSTVFSLESVSGSATEAIETVTFSIRQIAGGLYWSGSDWVGTLNELATNYHAPAGTWSHAAPLPAAALLTDGDYEFTVYGRNSAGVNVSSSSIATLYPNVALGVAINAPTGGGSLNGLTSVSGSASSQAQQVTLQIKRVSDDHFWNGGEWLAYPVALSATSSGSAGAWYYNYLPNFEPGDYQFTATATDEYYNSAQDSVTASAQPEAGPLTSLVISPATADVTNASSTFTVRLAAERALDFGTVTLTSPSGQTISGSFGEYSLSEGAYEFTLYLPRHREAGAWSVSAYLQDTDYRVTNYSPAGLQLPSGSTTEVLVVNTGPQDFSPPQVTSLTMTPSPATVTSASQEITVTIGISDDVGLNEGSFTLGSPGGSRNLYGYLGAETRISGTAANGTYQFIVTIPAHAEPGLWSARLYLSDVSERSAIYNATSSPAFPSGIDGTLTVVNTGGVDSEAPVLTALSFSASSVDVSGSSQQVTATLQVTDDFAGLKEGVLILENPGSPQSLSFPFGAAQRNSGTATDGTYTVSLTVPQYAPAGTWNARVTLADFSDSSRSYGSGYYDTLFPAGATTQLQIQNSGQADTVAPTLTSLSFSQSTVDVGNSSQSVTVTMQLSDDLSGVAGGYVGFWKDGLQRYTHFDTTAGANGTYQVAVTIPQGAASGNWNFGLVIQDVLGNWRAYGAASYYQPAPLLPAGAPSVLTVTIDTQTPFDQWTQSQFPAGTPADQMIPTADPDADNISNLLEYAFNMPPMSAGGREQLPATVVQRNALGQPAHLVMTYNERIGSSDLVYQVPVSSDMKTWDRTGASVEQVSATPNPDGVTRRVTVRVPTGAAEEKFMRIGVEFATP